MTNMIFADIISFILPEFLNDTITGNTPIQITQRIYIGLVRSNLIKNEEWIGYT